jgi:hypothetical protein
MAVSHPGHRQQALHDARDDRAADPERGAPEHHLVHRGPVADDVEQAEHRAPDDVAERDHDERLDQREPERDPERPEHPVDRGDVRSRPDPELLPRRGVAAGRRDRIDPVRVEGDGLGRLGRSGCGHGAASLCDEASRQSGTGPRMD